MIAKTYTNQLDEIFNFELASGFVNSANGSANSGITSAIKFTLKDMPDGQYATFLTNHDQNRVMSVLNGNVDKAKVAAALLLTAPGTPFIYYGEEIGMEGQKPDEDIRLPMQWAADATTAGFTSATPWRAPGTKTSTMNVAAEDKDPNSLLNHYRALIALRKAHPALQTGALTLLETGNSGVYAILRHNTTETILVVVNLSGKPITDYQLSLTESLLTDGILSVDIIFGTGSAAPLQIVNGKFDVYQPKSELAPFETLVLSIKQIKQ